MSRQRKLVLIGASMILVLAIFLSVVLQAPEQPVYEGKNLAQWLEQLERESNKGDGTRTILVPSAGVIRRMGSNVVPHLVEILRFKTPAWKISLARWTRRDRFPGINLDWRSREYQALDKATLGFWALDQKDRNLAIPSLTKLCQSSDAVLRERALGILGSFDYDDDRVLAAAVRCLKDSQAEVRVEAVKSLQNIDSSAKSRNFARDGDRGTSKALSAVPNLIAALQDPDSRVRSAVRAALQQIEPDAEANR